MKRVKIFALFVIIILISGFSFMYFKIESIVKHPISASNEKVKIEVVKGDTFFSLVNKLENDSIIENSDFLKLAVKYKKIATNIKVGHYEVDNNVSLTELLEILDSGVSMYGLNKVTIPEGYDIEAIGTLLQEKELVTKEEFIEACSNYTLPDYINANSDTKYNLEGYLFPDTYEFETGASSKDIIDKMIKRFETVIKDIKSEKNIEIKDLNETITVASIVEKETKVSEERSIVASVINNRLKKGMPLQIDATVLYAIGEHKERLYNTDLKIESVYNTYQNKGLTPGPISNPGRASIEAALTPDETDFLYYVYDADGKHYFTNNYNDFLAAKKRYKANN